MLSTGLNLDAQISIKSSTPDTFSLPVQVENTATLAKVTKKPIQSLNITPKTATTSTSLSIMVSGKTTQIFTTTSLSINPGSRVGLYESQFLFAHSSGPFSGLSSASSFQIIRNGTVENYQITEKVIYCDYSNIKFGPEYDCKNYSEPRLPARVLGNSTNYYEAYIEGHDFILMTCAGQSLPGQDATHRLLAYAIRV